MVDKVWMKMKDGKVLIANIVHTDMPIHIQEESYAGQILRTRCGVDPAHGMLFSLGGSVTCTKCLTR